MKLGYNFKFLVLVAVYFFAADNNNNALLERFCDKHLWLFMFITLGGSCGYNMLV